MSLDVLLKLRLLAVELTVDFLEVPDRHRKLLNLVNNLLELILGVLRLGCYVELELFVLFSVFLEGLLAFFQFFFLHDDVLLEKLSFLRLGIDCYLGHQNFPGPLNEVANTFFLLSASVEVVDAFAI